MSYKLNRTGRKVDELLAKIEALVTDAVPTADSANPVSSGGVKAALNDKQDKLTESTYGTKLADLAVKYGMTAGYGMTVGTGEDRVIIIPGSVRIGQDGKNVFDSVRELAELIPSEASDENQLADKAYVDSHTPKITMDDTPTADSDNPVKSQGIKTALDAKQDTISTVNVTVDNNTGTPSGSASVSGSTLSLSFQNLKGATGAQGPQGIQGVPGPQGPKGDTGVTGDASSLAIIHGIDKTTSYASTDVCGADAAQALLNEIEGGFYY